MNQQPSQNQFHYDLIAEAIRLIEADPSAQPSLDDIAARMGFSPTHFQRMFSEWVGVSPKRYLQYLTLDHAKRLLAERFTVLDATMETGLSSPGRLHDLFVRWEAMSPGDYAAGGEGLVIDWGWFESPFGPAIAMGTTRGLCGMGFVGEMGREAAFDDLVRRWPKATYRENPVAIAPWVDAAFRGHGEARLCLIGAPFQIKVWEALLTVPTGHVTTYSEIARIVGNPKAVRAVGTAVGRNPISWLIPCHRALRKTGELGGYHWGLPVKRAMLAYEAARLDVAEAP
ncbi:MAG: bifunctional helix-turn-helix domain-containing protein/methylated-DNA--[protein]-cysteine S-methyltransferase [Pseudomonadota bacterium]